MKHIISKWPDFKAQKSQLEEFCDKNGALVDLSPKCHPEVAGEGIEYDWACGKTVFRNENDFNNATLHARVLRALEAITLPRARASARRARDFLRGYKELDDGSGRKLSRQEIEEQKKKQARHRDVLQFSTAFVQALLALGVAEQGGT